MPENTPALAPAHPPEDYSDTSKWAIPPGPNWDPSNPTCPNRPVPHVDVLYKMQRQAQEERAEKYRLAKKQERADAQRLRRQREAEAKRPFGDGFPNEADLVRLKITTNSTAPPWVRAAAFAFREHDPEIDAFLVELIKYRCMLSPPFVCPAFPVPALPAPTNAPT